jgi:uncharacterized membrane protein
VNLQIHVFCLRLASWRQDAVQLSVVTFLVAFEFLVVVHVGEGLLELVLQTLLAESMWLYIVCDVAMPG